jgi:hypothetical protein
MKARNIGPRFKITDAHGHTQEIEASGWDGVTTHVKRHGKRNVYGIEGPGGKMRFYLCRNGETLWPISLKAAAVELAMGGFE